MCIYRAVDSQFKVKVAFCKVHTLINVGLRDDNTCVSMMSLLHRLIVVLMCHWYEFLEQMKHNC